VLLRQLEGALQALTAAVVLWFGLAASGVYPWNIPVGRAVRWAALAELAAVVVLYVLVAGRGRVSRAFGLLLGSFLVLALASTAWSPDASLTAGRWLTVAAVFVVGVSLAGAAARRAQLVEIVVLGVVAGVVLLALLGLANLWADSERAIVPPTTQAAARYNGIGGNPNTMAMLIALVLPAVVWLLISAPTRARRVLAVGVFALLFGSLVASGSRGALLGSLVGVLVFAAVAPLGRRRALVTGLAALTLFGAAVAVLEIPQPAKTNPVIRPDIVPPSTPALSPLDVQARLPLESEVGFPRPREPAFERTLFTSSGRLGAWEGALDQALERPLLGYGFGTEERVFSDRYYLHYSERPENSYLGTLLQLGVVGLVVLVALLALVVWRVRRVRGGPLAACAGALACGLVLAVSQSFLTSVGSPAMLPFWVLALLLVGATEPRVPRDLDERQRGEREEDPAERHREPSLDVVAGEDRRVGREQERGAAAGAAARDRDNRTGQREREQDPVDRP
jgi:O-antigen ligase